MNKKLLPLIIAVVIFGVALVLNRPEPQVSVVVAAADLPEKRVLSEEDMVVKEMPESLAPEGAVNDVQALVGQRLRVARSAGDPILPSHLGGEMIELNANERAVALLVTASQGLAGLLTPGDRVGLTVIVNNNQQTFAKYLAGGLRVLWVDPSFQREAAPAPASTSSDGGLFGGATNNTAPVSSDMMSATKGLVVLAVPTDAQVLLYDFSMWGAENENRPVYLLDLIPALSAQNAQFGLVLEPEDATAVHTSGIALQSLAVTPGPTMTPTPTAFPAIPATETEATEPTN